MDSVTLRASCWGNTDCPPTGVTARSSSTRPSAATTFCTMCGSNRCPSAANVPYADAMSMTCTGLSPSEMPPVGSGRRLSGMPAACAVCATVVAPTCTAIW